MSSARRFKRKRFSKQEANEFLFIRKGSKAADIGKSAIEHTPREVVNGFRKGWEDRLGRPLSNEEFEREFGFYSLLICFVSSPGVDKEVLVSLLYSYYMEMPDDKRSDAFRLMSEALDSVSEANAEMT